MLIVDVDLGVPVLAQPRDCAASCQSAVTQRQAIAALAALVEQFPALGFRVYRTRNGLRYLCTTQAFDPLSDQTGRLMQNLYADPLYTRLCRFQATFRARLTPKPWRMVRGIDAEILPADDWHLQSDLMTALVYLENNLYAVCHAIATIGEKSILPEFAPVIQLYDLFCRADQLRLELA